MKYYKETVQEEIYEMKTNILDVAKGLPSKEFRRKAELEAKADALAAVLKVIGQLTTKQFHALIEKSNEKEKSNFDTEQGKLFGELT